MNWNKILNVFICIFLFINLVILVVAQVKSNNEYSLSKEREEQLRYILNENNVAVYNYFPSYHPMAKVAIEVSKVDTGTIIEKFFGNESYEVTVTPLEESYKAKNQEIIFYKGDNEGIIYYKGNNDKYKPKEFTKENVKSIGEKFSRDITLDNAKYELTTIEYLQDTNSYILYYNEVFKGKVLFCSYVTLKVSEEGVKEAKVLRYEPKEFVSREVNLYPIDEVLYKFIDNIDLDEREFIGITDIDLGYDIGDSELDNNILVEAVPYYRIKLNSGEFYYINAYTNEFKKSEL